MAGTKKSRAKSVKKTSAVAKTPKKVAAKKTVAKKIQTKKVSLAEKKTTTSAKVETPTKMQDMKKTCCCDCCRKVWFLYVLLFVFLLLYILKWAMFHVYLPGVYTKKHKMYNQTNEQYVSPSVVEAE